MALTATETTELVRLLNALEPGNLPATVFEAIGRVCVYPAVELSLLRYHNGAIEVLLIKRDKTDMHWPEMLHIPGTIVRPTDQSFDDAFKRLNQDELSKMILSDPTFVGAFFSNYIRGTGIGFEYWVSITDYCGVGTFYDTNHLPNILISEQIPIIRRAVESFKMHYNISR